MRYETEPPHGLRRILAAAPQAGRLGDEPQEPVGCADEGGASVAIDALRTSAHPTRAGYTMKYSIGKVLYV